MKQFSGHKVLKFAARELKGRILTALSLAAFVDAQKAGDRLDVPAASREAAGGKEIDYGQSGSLIHFHDRRPASARR